MLSLFSRNFFSTSRKLVLAKLSENKVVYPAWWHVHQEHVLKIEASFKVEINFELFHCCLLICYYFQDVESSDGKITLIVITIL